MQGQSEGETRSFTPSCSCHRPVVTLGHGQTWPLVAPSPGRGGTKAPRGQCAPREQGTQPCWEEVTASCPFGSHVCFTGELKPSPAAPAPLPPSLLPQAHEKLSEGESPHPYGQFCASFSAPEPPAHPTSASPESDKTPQASHSLHPPRHAGTPGLSPPHTSRSTVHPLGCRPGCSPAPILPGTLWPSLRGEQAAPSLPVASQSESESSSQFPWQLTSFWRSSAGCRHVCN